MALADNRLLLLYFLFDAHQTFPLPTLAKKKLYTRNQMMYLLAS